MAEGKKAMDWKSPETQYRLAMSALASLESTTFSAQKMATYIGCTAKAITHQLPKLKSDIADLQKGSPSTPGADGDAENNADTAATPAAKSTSKKRPAKPKADGADGDGEVDPSPTKKAKTPAKPRAKKATAAAAAKEKEDDADNEAAEDNNAENEAVDAAEKLTIASPAKGKGRTPAKPKTPAKKSAASTKKGTATTTKKAGAKKLVDEDLNSDVENGEDVGEEKDDVEMGDDHAEDGVDDEIAKRKDVADGRVADEEVV